MSLIGGSVAEPLASERVRTLLGISLVIDRRGSDARGDGHARTGTDRAGCRLAHWC